jgi:hypothetical protein
MKYALVSKVFHRGVDICTYVVCIRVKVYVEYKAYDVSD